MTIPDPSITPRQGERRQGESDAMLLHIKELQGSIKELSSKMNYHHGIFEERVEKAVAKVYVSAFPDGDPDGHRRYHEASIAEAEARAAMWREVQGHLIKSGLFAAVCWLFYLAWTGALKGPHT